MQRVGATLYEVAGRSCAAQSKWPGAIEPLSRSGKARTERVRFRSGVRFYGRRCERDSSLLSTCYVLENLSREDSEQKSCFEVTAL